MAGVAGLHDSGDDDKTSSSRFMASSSFLAVSMEAAKPLWYGFGGCIMSVSGTTSLRSFPMAGIEERVEEVMVLRVELAEMMT